MTTDGITGNGTTTADALAAGISARNPASTLGQDDFLKLLVAQLGAQDPMNPQKDTEFIAQMAQFSALEQARTMQSDIAGMRGEQQIVQANALIGRTVQVQGENQTTTLGVVTGVTMVGGAPNLIVDGEAHPLSQVLGVTATPNPA